MSHVIPVDRQFPANKSLMKLLKEQPQEIERSQLFKDFKATLDQNRKKFMLLKSLLIDNDSDIVKEHCLNLRLDVDLARELKLKEQSDEIKVLQSDEVKHFSTMSDEAIMKIEQYEKDCLNGLSTVGFNFYFYTKLYANI